MTKPTTSHNSPTFIGIDFHKRYSVFCAIDSADRILEKGRIDHITPEFFVHLIKRHPGCRVVFETTMNCPSLRSRLANMASLDFKAAKWRRALGVALCQMGQELILDI